MDNSLEVSNEGGAVELSPELQSLADMANEYSDKPEVDVKSQSTEQLSEALEKKDGYEIYGPERNYWGFFRISIPQQC